MKLTADNVAADVCHDLHEGYVPGCGRCLSLADMQEARTFIASIVEHHLSSFLARKLNENLTN
jgi:hypothetical protein